MGKRKERRQLQTSGRRMKLDLSSDDVVGSDEIPRTTPDLVAENPLSLLGQYSDDETDKEEELAEKFTSLPSTKSPDQQGNAEASPLANEICQINIEIEQNGGEQNFSCSSKNEAVENDWKAVFDENSGQYYYWNLRTGETTWKMPVLGELVKVDDHSVAEGESVCVIDSSKAANVVDVQDAQDNRLSSHSLDNLIEHTEKVASHREILSEFGLNAEINKVSHAEDLLENSQCVRNSDGNLDSDSHFPSNSNVEIVSKPDDKSCDNAGSETAIVKIADKDEETVQTIEEGLTLEVDRTIEDFRESKCRDPSNVSESMIVTNVCHEAPVLDARSTLEEGSALLAEREESIQQKLKKLAGNSIEKPSNHALMAIRLEIQLGVWKAFCGLGFVPEACFSFICSELTKIESILDEEIEYIKKSNISQSRIVDAHNESKLANSLFMGTSTNGSIDNVGGKVQEPASGMLTTDEYVQTSETHNGQICTWYRSSTEVCNYSLDDGLVDTDMEVDMEVDNDGKNEPPVPGIGPDSVVTANSFPVPVSDPLHSSESQFHSAPNNSNIWVPPLPVEEEWAPPLPGETESIPPPPPEEPPPLPLNSLQLQSSYMLGSNVSCVDYYNSEYMTSAAGYIAAPEYQSLAMDSSMYGAYMQEVPGAYALNAIPVETGEIVEPYISDPSSAYLQWTSPFPPKSSVSYPVVSQKPLPSSSTVALSPALCTTSDNMAATTNSEAKKAPKGKPIKKRTHSVASAPMLNKKVSSLVSKWKQAKEELHGGEDEDDKALYDIEVLEKKKQKEIEEWRRQQIASGEALDNANFQPLGAIDWRDRVKKAKKSDATEGDVRENPSVPTQEIEREVRKTDKSIVAEMSRGLPDDWQAFWDEESGEVYYGNLKTKETSWTRPVVKSTGL